MDFLTLLLILVALFALTGWGYGTYRARRPVPAGVEAAPPARGWTAPLGTIGFLALILVVLMILTGWHATGVELW